MNICAMVGKDVLQALTRLNHDPDFAVFMDEVKRRREAARDSLELSTDAWLTGRAQGAAQLAGELIDLQEGARLAFAKLQAAGRGLNPALPDTAQRGPRGRA